MESRTYKGYTVFENGDIISKRFNRPLSPGKNSNGYFCVNIAYNNVIKNEPVHRIIALSFIPNPENKPCVNHIDGNKLNNAVQNLEWVTVSENRFHAYKTGLCENHRKTVSEIGIKTIKKAIEACSKQVLNMDTGETYSSIKEAADKNGYKHSTLWHYLNTQNKNKTNLILSNN